MSNYELGKDIAEIKERLSKIEELLKATYNADDSSNKGPKEPQLAGGNGGATGRPNN